MWESLKTKLTSRKFWLSVASFVSSLLVIFNVEDGTVAQVTAIITAAATVIAYVIGEGITDAASLTSTEEEDDGE